MMSYRLASVLLRAVLLVLALAIGVGAMAGETIVGEVIDQGCFLRQEARGADHQECAARCLRNGNPAGVLTDEGEVYTLATSAAAFKCGRTRARSKCRSRNSDRPKKSSSSILNMKTVPSDASVEKFLEGVKDERQREDTFTLLKI